MTKKKAIILGAAIVAVLVTVLVVVLLVPKGGSKKDDAPATFDEGIDLKVSVDGDKLHQAEVVTDKDGNISNNSYGTLMEYYPANIRDIHIENKQGSFDVISETPEGQATVYTIKGFEDFDLQPGNPDVIARYKGEDNRRRRRASGRRHLYPLRNRRRGVSGEHRYRRCVRLRRQRPYQPDCQQAG